MMTKFDYKTPVNEKDLIWIGVCAAMLGWDEETCENATIAGFLNHFN